LMQVVHLKEYRKDVSIVNNIIWAFFERLRHSPFFYLILNHIKHRIETN
jgi:hypothetical protein